jgi:hypothetical protein
MIPQASRMELDLLFIDSNEALRLLPPTLDGSQRVTPPGSGGKIVGP